MATAGERERPPMPAREAEIAGLTADSRAVRPGFLFAALPGTRADGRAYLDEALARGAVAVLAPAGVSLAGTDAVLVNDANPRRRFAQMAAQFYGLQPSLVAAVTGTNGKTSVARFTQQIWTHLGLDAASIGTLGVAAPGFAEGPALTTPDPVELHRVMADLARAGVDHAAIEASSHGLAQFRLDGVRIAAGAFTNLTRDHLDYHGTIAAYRAAKLRLFAEILPAGATAVLNADAADYATFATASRARGLKILSYGTNGVEIRIEQAMPLGVGQRLRLAVFGASHEIEIPLAGAFQAANLVCALGLVLACGAAVERAVATLGRVSPVRGRLELVASQPDGAPVYVDYAHTPDALETVLAALRPHARGRIVLVFGCGGDRDPGKRPLMGEIAAKKADYVIVTDDNPRSEEPAKIRRQILAACPAGREIADRAQAIAAGLAVLGPDDLLLVAGKGHESGQIVGTESRAFDDADVARRAMAELQRRSK